MSDAVRPPARPPRSALEGAACGLVFGFGFGSVTAAMLGVGETWIGSPALLGLVIVLFLVGIFWRAVRVSPQDRAFRIPFRIAFVAAVILMIATCSL